MISSGDYLAPSSYSFQKPLSWPGSLWWPLAVAALFAEYEVLGDFPLIGSSFSELGVFLLVLGYSASRVLCRGYSVCARFAAPQS